MDEDHPIMASQVIVVPSTTATLIVKWANEQDAWIRTAAKAILDNGVALTEAELDALYEQFLIEKQLKAGTPTDAPALIVPANEAGIGQPLRLVSIKDIQHVNALAAGQTITFNPKLTIIFGENAAGKTGYVRILKRACNSRTKEPILPNLYRGVPGTPIATIECIEGEQTSILTWRNEEGISPINRVDVFDVRAATIHVDDDLTYTYTPGELNRFPHLQHAIGTVKERLEQSITQLATRQNPYLQHFMRGTPLYPVIESLGANTDLGMLQTQATLTPEEEQRIKALEIEIEALKSNTPQAQLQLARTRHAHLTTIHDALLTISKVDPTVLQTAQTHLQTTSAQHERASKEAFANLPIPGILQAEWRAFIEAGEAYVAHHHDGSYPTTNNPCAYCQQTLTPAAVTLLRSYRDYCSNTFRNERDTAQLTLDAVTKELLAINATTLAQTIASIELDATLVQQLQQLQEQLPTVQDRLRAHELTDVTALVARAAAATGDITTALQETEALITTFQERTSERVNALKTRADELASLVARTTLRTFLAAIREHVVKAQWVDKARIQFQRFMGIQRSLTDTAKAASEEALNKNFAKRFEEECKLLRAPAITLDFPGRQGQVTRRKAAVPNHRLNTVLSEGEQKVIALADFLAELALKPPAPVVFDDPITSLDYKRLRELVTRIAALSEQRQVIVFTHNIWFTTELLSQFDDRRTDCSYYGVAKAGDEYGIITHGTHPRADTYNSLRGRLNANIQAAQSLTGEPQAALIEKGYELLRSICEVIVETELLFGVNQRHEPNVRMTSLTKIKGDRLASAITVIMPIFEDCCRYMGGHSQPMETLNVRPTLDDLKTAWANVQAALAAYKT